MDKDIEEMRKKLIDQYFNNKKTHQDFYIFTRNIKIVIYIPQRENYELFSIPGCNGCKDQISF